MLDTLWSATSGQAALFFLIANVLICLGSITLCWAIGKWYSRKRIFDRWESIRAIEIGAVVLTIFLNAAVSVAGWWLWKAGWIDLSPTWVLRGAIDCLVMILAMDFGMYVFHRLAHMPLIYKILHNFHHRHETTNPMSLFVLHPAEVIGFGGLMIGFLILYPMTVTGLIAYLTLNVLFGTLGHSGVEPFPARLRSVPVLKWIGTSTFHAEHHEHPGYNFGFYTLIWDKLIGTLDPEYDTRYAQEKPAG